MGSCAVCDTALDESSKHTCDYCGGSFCSIHRARGHHSCDSESLTRSAKMGNYAATIGAPFRMVRGALSRVLSVRLLATVGILLPVLLFASVGAGVLSSGDVAGTPGEGIVRWAEGAIEDYEESQRMNESETESIVLEKVNDRRAAEGLPELQYREEASEVAQAHAEDMAEHGYVGHTNSEGYNQERRYGFCSGGENIHQTWHDEPVELPSGETERYTNEKEVAESTVEAWMDSTPHRERGIHGPWWKSAGVGVATSGDRVFIVLGFCET